MLLGRPLERVDELAGHRVVGVVNVHTKARRHHTDEEVAVLSDVAGLLAQTEVPNLFLAGDYVQTNIDLATMEGANESGRAAVNALLEASGSKAGPAMA